MLNSNEMVDACNGNTFKYADFEDMLTNYSVYLNVFPLHASTISLEFNIIL